MSNTINLLIVFAIFMAIALFWHQMLRMTSEESICMSAVSVMLCVFLFGAIDHVRYVYLLFAFFAAIGILAFIFDFSLRKKDKSSLRKRVIEFINPSVVMLILVFIYSGIAFRGAIFTYPDELAQWGVAVRYMVQKGGLPYGSDFPGEAITLSTATMFQYLWVGLGKFVEKNCLVGNFLLAMIPVYLPFSGATWKDWKKISIFTLIIFLSFNVITYVKYYSLLQDFVLPMWAGGVIAWLLWVKKKRLNWFVLLGALLCIGAMKSMVSPLFSVIIIGVLIIRQIIICQPKTIKDVLTGRTVFLAVATICSVLLLSIIWSMLIGENAYGRASVAASQAKDVNGIVEGIINKSMLISSDVVPVFPFISYFMMFSLGILGIYLLQKRISDLREKRLFVIVFFLYEVGFIAYLLVMLYAYLYVFGGEDSAIVAGLERYLAYYMLLGVVPWVSLFFKESLLKTGKEGKIWKIGLLVFLVLGTGNGFVAKASTVKDDEVQAYQDRMDIQERIREIDSLRDGDGNIYILGKLSSTESKMLAYEFNGTYAWSTDCYQIYQRTDDDTIICCDMVKYPQLLEQLQYDYLWIYQFEDEIKVSTERLQYRYGLKNLKDGALYKIDKTDTGIELQYLGKTNESKGE